MSQIFESLSGVTGMRNDYIAILETGVPPAGLDATYGTYADMFAALLASEGRSFKVFRTLEGKLPDQDEHLKGVVITGSPAGVYESDPWIVALMDWLRALDTKTPVVGICFGHQIIAQAMGGKVERYAGGWAVGATDYDFNGQHMTLNAWHRDQVTEKPANAKVLATNDFCTNAALLYDDRMLTVQAHPEFRPEFIDGLMQTRGKGLVPEDVMAAAANRLSDPIQDQTMAAQIAAFFKAKRQ